jgi:ATP-dependent helicase HrpB
MVQLPIDPLLPEIVSALRRSASLVIEAPPGAGKTTRVPRALLEAGLAGDQEVVVLEPRRLAARLSARRVAFEMGERPGETVGYQVRFEEVAGPRTRLRYVTEGLLTRRLMAEPTLPGVGAVVLDEFHERHLQGDLALALLRRLQETSRPELKLVVMSATLDAGPVAAYLGAPSLRSEGRRFEVAVEYLTPAEAAQTDLPLERRISAALRRLVNEGLDGDVLVFLPGAAEIRRAREACEPVARAADLDLLALHGDLPPEEQDRAVQPGPRRKVILSTNVAETSVTIEGVVAVIDSGLARVASHSPWSGLPRLEVKKVSRASAAQRAGRAGRLRPGRALRLYTRHDHDSRPEFDAPEVKREDLAEPLLALAALGASELRWFEPPPEPAVEAARTLLSRLGAFGPDGAVTDLGRRMLRFPLHPRQARLVVEAEARGLAAEGCLLAALLGERDIRERGLGPGPKSGPLPPTGPSDLLELAAAFSEAEQARFGGDRLRALGLSGGATQAVDRSRRQLLRLCKPGAGAARRSAAHLEPAQEEALLLATLAAYPDRVGRRRAGGSDEVVLVGGGSGRLDPVSVVREAPILVAVDVEERRESRPGVARGGVTIRLASAVTQEMLLDLFPDALRFAEEATWNAQAERVDAVERLLYGDLVLEEKRAPKVDPEKAAALLAEAALARGVRSFGQDGGVDAVLARLAFLAKTFPESGIAAPGEETLRRALAELCQGRRSFAELREAGLEAALLAQLEPAQRGLLEKMAPERVTLPGGRSVRVEYEPDKAPHIESRLQDFFGMATGPTVAGGRVALVLHLLAPNQRAVQVTTDLAGFWERHYPALRRELGRRYPRHSWPEDPRTARPPEPRRR